MRHLVLHVRFWPISKWSRKLLPSWHYDKWTEEELKEMPWEFNLYWGPFHLNYTKQAFPGQWLGD